MGRIQGLSDTLALTESELLKTGAGYVFSVTIAWANQTVGVIVTLRDGTDGASAPLAVFAIPTASGTITKEWPQGKRFENGLYYDEGAGEIWTEITYK